MWIHWLPRCMQVLIWSYWIYHHSHNSDCSCWSCKAQREPLMFPISCEHSWWFLWIPCPPGQWNKSLAIFLRYQDGAFHSTTFASPSAWHSFPFYLRFLDRKDLDWMSYVFSLISLRTTYIRLEVLLPIEWKPVHESDKSLDPSIFQ